MANVTESRASISGEVASIAPIFLSEVGIGDPTNTQDITPTQNLTCGICTTKIFVNECIFVTRGLEKRRRAEQVARI